MLCDVYSKKDDFFVGLGRLFTGWLLTLGILFAVGIACNASSLFPFEILLLWAAVSYPILALCYIPIHSLSRYYHRQLHERQKSLIIGTGKLATDLANTLARQKRSPLVGLVGPRTTSPQAGTQPQILGDLPDLPALIRQHGYPPPVHHSLSPGSDPHRGAVPQPAGDQRGRDLGARPQQHAAAQPQRGRGGWIARDLPQ